MECSRLDKKNKKRIIHTIFVSKRKKLTHVLENIVTLLLPKFFSKLGGGGGVIGKLYLFIIIYESCR